MRIWKFVHYNNDTGSALCMSIALRTAIPIARLHDIPGGEYTDYVKFDAQVQEKEDLPRKMAPRSVHSFNFVYNFKRFSILGYTMVLVFAIRVSPTSYLNKNGMAPRVSALQLDCFVMIIYFPLILAKVGCFPAAWKEMGVEGGGDGLISQLTISSPFDPE